jgi:hypothetical protein
MQRDDAMDGVPWLPDRVYREMIVRSARLDIFGASRRLQRPRSRR